MVKLQHLMIGLVAGVLTLSTSFAGSVPDLYKVKQELIQYHDSGDYMHEIVAVDQQAAAYLLSQADQNAQLPAAQQKKLAVVFDIDETALSNYPNMKAFDFGGTLQDKMAAMNQGNDPAIQPTLMLYQLALKHKVAVFFITGRPQSMQQSTTDNLHKVGFTNWNSLIMRPNDYNQSSIVSFKSSARQKIVNAGYDILFTIGDQNSDLKGGYADKTFKLPNPYYYLP